MPTHHIFVSYRRADSAYVSANIRERLERAFGPESIFMDVHSMLVGMDFRTQLEDAVSKCDVLLAVIGNNWEGKSEDKQTRRIDDPADFVRIEVEWALKRGIPVIPVLVDSASVPKAAALPESLKALSSRGAAEVRPGRDLDTHLQRLVESIQLLFDKTAAPTDRAEQKSRKDREASKRNGDQRSSNKAFAIVVGLAVVAVVAYAGFRIMNKPEAPPSPDGIVARPLNTNTRWQVSSGATSSGFKLEIAHPDDWKAEVAPNATSSVSYRGTSIRPDAGMLSLALPGDRGLLLVGLDSAKSDVAIDALIGRRMYSLTRGALTYDLARTMSKDVYQSDVRMPDGAPAGIFHVAIQRSPTGTFALWRLFLGDPATNATAVQIAMDSLRVKNN